MNAVRLRKSLTFLLLRDLGVKSRTRNMTFITKPMDDNDSRQFKAIAEKYGIASCIDEYPNWIIDKFRDSIWSIMRDMLINITRAYTVWPTNNMEAQTRREHMDIAIADCESLLKELELAVDVLPIDADKYMPYVEQISREISLLKGWRKSDNKRFKDLH